MDRRPKTRTRARTENLTTMNTSTRMSLSMFLHSHVEQGPPARRALNPAPDPRRRRLGERGLSRAWSAPGDPMLAAKLTSPPPAII